MKRFALIGAVLAVFVLAALISADSRSIRFEASQGYSPGSIDGQNGWAGMGGGPILPLIDQKVETNTYGYPSFGGQSWRMSNAYADGAFAHWPFSPSLVNEAGETMAQNLGFSGGTRQRHFEVQWDFASAVPTAHQPDLQVSTAPDRGDGARMSYVRMEDHSDGLYVFFDDYQDKAPYGSYGSPVNAAKGCQLSLEDGWVETTVASGLNRSKAHTVKLTMDFIDGPRNDVVKVYVDGTLRHAGGTSWEDYFRWCAESGGGTGTTANDQSRTVDSMIFQARNNAAPFTAGKGFLIDNLTYFSSPAKCRHGHGDGDFEDEHGHKHHGRFDHCSCAGDEGHEGHGNGHVEHDDHHSGKHFESSSVSSATYTSNTDGQAVTMIGTGLHDGLPVGFTMIAVDHGDLVPGIFTLVLTDGYSVTGSLPTGAIVIDD